MAGDRSVFDWQKAMTRDRALDAATKHVGLQISLYMDAADGGGAYPEIRRLAKETSRKPHTVIAAIEKLAAAGWLHKRRGLYAGDNAGRAEPNRYAARWPKGQQSTDAPRDNSHTNGAVAPTGLEQMSQGATEVLKTSTATSTPAALIAAALNPNITERISRGYHTRCSSGDEFDAWCWAQASLYEAVADHLDLDLHGAGGDDPRITPAVDVLLADLEATA